MTDKLTPGDLAVEIGTHLPYLRRYARALTGSQTTGDNYAAATLEAILEDPSTFDGRTAPKIALFRAFHLIWQTTGSPQVSEESGLRGKAQQHLITLTANTREALLLQTVEDFSTAEVAEIMAVSEDEARHFLTVARQEMEDAIAGAVLIIEDEAIIAMDLEALVADMGHRVTGVARTRDQAVELARTDPPDLILADIQLADNSSGIDAVNSILDAQGERPVVFITAFPERLLTGERPEPAFMISKPFTEEQVRSAVSQAMFFSSTETLRA